MATVLMCLVKFWGERENILKVEDGGLKVPISEPVEDDSQKIQGGNGQGKSGSHPIDDFLKGFEGLSFNS
jgi:hypothetical protein